MLNKENPSQVNRFISGKKQLLFIILILFVTIVTNAQWQQDVRLTNNTAISNLVPNNSWAIKANGNILHVVWADNRNGSYEIYYKRSTDGGISWGTDTRLTTNNNILSPGPSVAISGTTVHIVWWDTRNGGGIEIYYKRSADEGVSWGPETRLTNAFGTSSTPSLSVSGSVVHVVWQDERDSQFAFAEIYYKRSTDGGITWEPDRRMTNDPLNSLNPSVAVNGSTVQILWQDFRDGSINGNSEIYYKRSTDDGFSWGQDTRLTNDSSISELSSVAVSGSTVSLLWSDFRDGNSEIYYKRSINDGISWGTDTRLTNDGGNSSSANVTASGLYVNVTWRDDRDGNQEIYYKRSTDGGSSWGADIQLTNSAGISDRPSIAVWGSTVHVVWQDIRDGNFEIYYKRNPSGNTDTFTVSGQVTYRDNGLPVNNGFVKALHYDRITTNLITVDSTVILPGGFYTLPRVPGDTTYIMYYQNDDDPLDFVPTYYQSTIDWQQAATLYPNENLTNINGQVYRITNSGASNLHIGGTCYTLNDQPLTALDNVIIYAKIGNEFKNYGISNSNGLYTAPMLPAGSYTLYAYRIGYNYLTRYETITNNSLDTINFYFGSPIGIINITTSVPSQYKLSQNYPNPFNPVTKIRFALPKSSFAKIVIYDLLGREVETLVNEQLNSGTYEVDWYASKYSSGVYFYKLETEGFVEIKKMVLIK